MDIYAIRLFEIDANLFKILIKYVSEERKNRICKLKNNRDKNRILISELLTRKIIYKKLKLNNDQIYFDKNQFGKPFLKDYENFYFNISHSGKWIICATDCKTIGIDIEKIRSINYKELAKNYFTNEECRFILETSANNQIRNFYRMWTLKESYIKAEGRGLSIPLKSFSIDINNKRINKVNSGYCEYFLKEIEIDYYYKMSVCSLNPSISNDVIIISENNLVNTFLNKTI
ncbi:4-phosphopantetheinyl transferase [Clostridium diolis]|uniref:4'-phosphopantetheinyl transferase family protein n=1 Tax=Clostridium diolis TaxID=223919 RepID=UPI000D123EE1|nr:4'-phosphopantetheinyl transferase superfamily protein [Clostridium diolis]PSM56691.1 4-phosphopantetheinyl transferase [Clostridium diolis]